MIDKETITPDGAVFLICMFLEPEQAFLMMNQIKGFKGTHQREFLATRYVFTEYCVNMPHERIISVNNQDALALDILNELGKCPYELYQILNETDKKKFLPDLEDTAINHIFENSLSETVDDTIDFDDFIRQRTKQVRYAHRFAYHSLSYIDHTEMLGEYRFQISLGKVELKRYTKQLGETQIDRVIHKELTAFGRLTEFQDEATLAQKLTMGNPFSLFNPHYKIHEHKIALHQSTILPKIGEDGKIKLIRPKAFLSLHELPKIFLLNYLRPDTPAQIIKDYIRESRLDDNFIQEIKGKLPEWRTFNMKFDLYKKNERDELAQRKKKLNKVLSKYKKTDKQIPAKIIYYWLNIRENRKATKDFIKGIRGDCKLRIKQMNDTETRNKRPLVGDMATFLAQDCIKMLIKEETKNKCTTPYYREIQKAFAFYTLPAYKRHFEAIANELNLFDVAEHLFLYQCNANKLSNTAEFYTRYLNEKIKWIDTTFYKREGRKTKIAIPTEQGKIPFTIRKKAKNRPNFEEWKQCLPNKTPNLPTDIFDQALKQALIEELERQHVACSTSKNWNELFKLWWKEVRKDTPQPFYNYDRSYEIYDHLINFTPDKAQTLQRVLYRDIRQGI